MTAALILSDMLWRDSSMDNSGGGGGAAVPAQARPTYHSRQSPSPPH